MKAFDFSGKTALVTGASMGIGAEFARALSRKGATLVLVARSAQKLEALAKELGGDAGKAHVVVADLAAPGAAKRLFDEVSARGLEVDVLVNNAGFGVHGPFEEIPLATQREQIDLNVGVLVELTHLFLPAIERRQGGVILLSSMAGYQPVPYFAVYAATKAFVLSFGEALWAEYRPRGVRVLVLAPGATDTAFFERAGEVPGTEKKALPADVVALGLSAFSAGRASVLHGALNATAAFVTRFVGRELVAKTVARLTKPKPKAAAPDAAAR